MVVFMPFTTSVSTIEQKEEHPESYSESGEERFGLVTIGFYSADGLPESDYKGFLKNIDVTFSGNTTFTVSHPIFIRKNPPVILETTNDLHVKIDLFYGMIVHNNNYAVLLGYGWGISWNET